MKTKFFLLLMVLTSVFWSCKRDKITYPYPTQGLISYFNFDDNLKDQHGYSFDGDPTGNPVFIEGKAGKAILFNGLNQDVIFQAKSQQNSNEITLSCWFRTEPQNERTMLACKNTSNIISINTNANNAGLVVSHPATDSVFGFSLLGEWNHFVGTFDGNSINVYINGNLAATKNHPGTITGFSEFLVLGKHASVNEYWAGSIDDLFIYHRILSPEEIQQLYKLH